MLQALIAQIIQIKYSQIIQEEKNKKNKINFPETAIANWFVTVLKKFLNTVSVSPGITELILAQLTL